MDAPRPLTHADPLPFVGPWTLLGAAIGLLAQLGLAMSGQPDSKPVVPAVVGGAAIGVAVWVLSRRRPRGSGVARWGVWSAVLLAVPVVLAVGVLGTVARGDSTVFGVAGVTAVLLMWFAWRGLGRSWLGAALDAAREGDDAALITLARRRGLPDTTRAHAEYALAMQALQRGEAGAARAHLQRVEDRRLQPLARVALALVEAVDGEAVEAEQHLTWIPGRVRHGTVAAQIDAVRLLLVTRHGDPDDASALAERLVERNSTALLKGLVAWHRWQRDDLAGVFELLDPTSRGEVERLGLRALVREVDEVLTAVPGS